MKRSMWSPARHLLRLLAPVALAIGCAGAPFPAPIEGEPVCPDFELGLKHEKMNGSLRFPVRLQIIDGKRVAMKVIIDGKRTASAPPAHTYIADDNVEYTAEWAQCENERAPVPTTEPTKKGHTPKVKEGGAYECGEAVVYKTEKFVTKKHDKESHKLTFVSPPKPECWVSDVPAAADTGDAGAPDAASTAGGAAASAAPSGAASAAPPVAPPSAPAAPPAAPPSASAAPPLAPKK